MGYMVRLGLWGEGNPAFKDFPRFLEVVQVGGAVAWAAPTVWQQAGIMQAPCLASLRMCPLVRVLTVARPAARPPFRQRPCRASRGPPAAPTWRPWSWWPWT